MSNPPKYSLHGVFDPARLEEILSTLARDVERQTARIAQLEHEAKERPSSADMQRLQGTMDQLANTLNQRIDTIDMRLNRVEQTAAQLSTAAARWDATVREFISCLLFLLSPSPINFQRRKQATSH